MHFLTPSSLNFRNLSGPSSLASGVYLRFAVVRTLQGVSWPSRSPPPPCSWPPETPAYCTGRGFATAWSHRRACWQVEPPPPPFVPVTLWLSFLPAVPGRRFLKVPILAASLRMWWEVLMWFRRLDRASWWIWMPCWLEIALMRCVCGPEVPVFKNLIMLVSESGEIFKYLAE